MSNKPKIYIDGQAGTTGLKIYERLSVRNDIELIQIEESKRKDVEERKKCINEADLVFLCLPDQAAIEAVSLVENSHTKVIDASSAHRTNVKWIYGMSELGSKQKEVIASSQFVANPGCHASGVIMSMYPLVKMGFIKEDAFISAFSITGYSGGGKSMIHQYENEKTTNLEAPRIYGLTQSHKHIPEIMKVCGLKTQPSFNPIVSDYYSGMATTISLNGVNKEDIYKVLSTWYQDCKLVEVKQCDEGMISANTKSGLDSMEIIVTGKDDTVCVTCLFDNLGKGACGAAIQNMNIMLGFDELTGLNI